MQWTYRSLAEFNGAALHSLAAEYDLLVIDHPMVPRDARVLTPLEALPAVRAARTTSIAATGTMYDWAGSTFAVPIDVAAHVSAQRTDLLERLGGPTIRDWCDVLTLAERHPGQVVASLTGDDALCTLLTIAASGGEPVSLHAAPAATAVKLLMQLAERCPRACIDMRPPDVLELLVDGRAAYAPALFGYATYLRTTDAPLRYGPVPRHPQGDARGLMGGAGLAVSASARNRDAALAFVDWISTPATQRLALLAAGGQPATRALWDDRRADALLGGFLTQTRHATRTATIRPRDPRWPRFQVAAADLLADALARGWAAGAVHSALAEVHTEAFTGEA